MQIVTIVTICLLFLCSGVASAAPSDSTAPVLTKDPTTAVFMSLALPGLGQYYTEQYWKIPLFTGACGVTAYLFFYYNSKYNQVADIYDQAASSGASSTELSAIKAQREAYRDNRDLSGVVFLSAYILAAVDAYVGANLFDFDVTEDLTVGFVPDPRTLASLHLQARW